MLLAASARRLQPLHFFQRQRAVFPGRNIERQRSIADALDLFHVMPHGFKHAPNLAIAAFDQRDLIPRIRGLLHNANRSRPSSHALAVIGSNRNTGAQFGDRRFCRRAGNFYQISFRDVRRRFHEPVRELAVIGQQQQAFTGVVESADRIDASPDAAEQVHHGGPLLRIAHGSDVSFWLVQQQVHVTLLLAL